MKKSTFLFTIIILIFTNNVLSQQQVNVVKKLSFSDFQKTLRPDMGYDTIIAKYGNPDIMTGSGICILIYNFADSTSLMIGCHSTRILYAIYRDRNGIKHDIISMPSPNQTKTRRKLKKPKHNTDGLINCLPQPGQLRNQLYKSMLATSTHLLNSCTLTAPSAETKSMGLRADALVPCFLLAT